MDVQTWGSSNYQAVKTSMYSAFAHSLPGECSNDVLAIVGDCLEQCSGKQISSSNFPVQHISNFSDSAVKSVQDLYCLICESSVLYISSSLADT